MTPPPLNCRTLALVPLLPLPPSLTDSLLRFASVNDSDFNLGPGEFIAGPTLGVAVVAWLLGVAGTITILVLRSRVTSEDEGPLRKCISGGGGSAGQHVGTV